MIFIYALRDRKSGVLTGLSVTYEENSSIIDFYLIQIKSLITKKLVLPITDYDVVKLGYYDEMKKCFVTDDNVLLSINENIIDSLKSDNEGGSENDV